MKSQNGYSISPESFDNAFNEDLENVTYLRFEAFMENSADSTIAINWEITNMELPIHWGLSVNDKDMSYPPGPQIVTNNFNPLLFDAGETNIPFNVDVYPNQIPGCGNFDIVVTLSETGFVLDTIEYKISVNDDNCLMTSINDPTLREKIEVFPNPFSNLLKISTASKIEKIRIYDSKGIPLAQLSDIKNNLDLSKLEKGLYYLEVILVNGHRTVNKVLKHN